MEKGQVEIHAPSAGILLGEKYVKIKIPATDNSATGIDCKAN